MPLDRDDLQRQYDALAAQVRDGSLPMDEAIRQLDALVAVDEDGVFWRMDPNGSLFRGQSEQGPWVPFDPHNLVSAPQPAANDGPAPAAPPQQDGWQQPGGGATAPADLTQPPAVGGAPSPGVPPAHPAAPAHAGATPPAAAHDPRGMPPQSPHAPAPPQETAFPDAQPRTGKVGALWAGLRQRLPLRTLIVAGVALTVVLFGAVLYAGSGGGGDEVAAPDDAAPPVEDDGQDGSAGDEVQDGSAGDDGQPPRSDPDVLAAEGPVQGADDEDGTLAPSSDDVRLAIMAVHSGSPETAAAAIDNPGNSDLHTLFAAMFAGWDRVGVSVTPGPLEPQGEGSAVQRWTMVDNDTGQTYAAASVVWVFNESWLLATWPQYERAVQ